MRDTCGNFKKNLTMKIEYSGNDISDKIRIKKDANHSCYTIDILLDEPWQLYAGQSVSGIDVTNPILSGVERGNYKIDIKDNKRLYFLLSCALGQGIFTESHITLEGGYNMHDQGGIRNKEGRYIKWGKIFRSDDLYKLTSADLEFLTNLNIRTVVDFRAPEEIAQAPDKLPTATKSVVLSLKPGNLTTTSMEDMVKFTKEKTEDYMYDVYRFLVSEAGSVQYKAFFKLVQEPSDVPLAYHCSAGKDRTGMAAALFQLALDVPEEAVYKDYMKSNVYLVNKYQKYISQYPQLESMFIVKEEFLKVGLDEIKKNYQSISNYLTKVLDVDIVHLKKMYLS